MDDFPIVILLFVYSVQKLLAQFTQQHLQVTMLAVNSNDNNNNKQDVWNFHESRKQMDTLSKTMRF